MAYQFQSRTGRTLHAMGVNARQRASERPQETRWTIGGTLAGLGLYAIIGGIGVALMGTAFSLLTWLTFPVAGLLIGRRFGRMRDQSLINAAEGNVPPGATDKLLRRAD